MVEVDFEADDLEEAKLSYFFQEYGAAIDREYSAVAERAAEIIRGWLEDFTPRGKTNTTATSWRVIAFDRNEYEITNTNEPIITYLTEGTKAHWIEASLDHWLHWTDDSGFDHFAQMVWHPGTQPIDIVGQALDAADPELEALWDAALDAADRDVGFV